MSMNRFASVKKETNTRQFSSVNNHSFTFISQAVVPTVMYGSESWGMKVNERQKLNVFEMKCLSMTSVSRLDRVRNEVVRARTGVRRELAARVDISSRATKGKKQSPTERK